MSTRSKLLAKTGDLQIPADDATQVAAAAGPNAPEVPSHQAPQFPGITVGSTPRTGPGQMLQFRGQMLAVEGELATLRERLKAHEGSLPTRKLDPNDIIPSQWANRHPDAFKSPRFESLKQDILAAGGNVQPICVRPAASTAGKYEIVFGHRRHRACGELGLPVLATIETAPISELELFAAMDRENRERADLSPYEQGVTYRRALDAGLYPSNRRLAEALGVSHTWVANVLLVADLPAPVIECFRTPIEVQHRHAKAISAAIDADRKGVLRRAEKLRQTASKPSPATVVATLIKSSDAGGGAPKANSLEVAGKTVGEWQRDRAGRLTIRINSGAVPEERIQDALQALASALEG
jgi:ParB family transcriptional regulator, chromosome partitioning protein